MSNLKVKLFLLFAAAGALAAVSVNWLLNDKPVPFLWMLAALGCGWLGCMFSSSNAFVAKVAIPSAISGASLMLGGIHIYMMRENYYNSGGMIEFPIFAILFVIAIVFAAIARKVKEPEAPKA